MLNEEQTVRKLAEAHRVMERCVGEKGLYASPQRYFDQCWTRDFAYAGLEYLIRHDRWDLARRHLENLGARQLKDGRVPIMFLDNEPRWLWGKLKATVRNRRLSFLLKRYFTGNGVGWLSPWTRDSEFLFAYSVAVFARRTSDFQFYQLTRPRVDAAILYAEDKLCEVRETGGCGLIRGADWRDTRMDLDSARLLSNNCWLRQAYALMIPCETVKMMNLSEDIRARFWNGTHFRDYVGSDEPRTPPDTFDTFGNALAVLTGVASWDQAHSIVAEAEKCVTRFGYRLNTVTLPPKNEEERQLMSRISQDGVIWPFIHGYMTLAALKIGRHDIAERGLAQWNRLDGFWEYYDPQTGQGHGSPDQMWSAAIYDRVVGELRNYGLLKSK